MPDTQHPTVRNMLPTMTAAQTGHTFPRLDRIADVSDDSASYGWAPPTVGQQALVWLWRNLPLIPPRNHVCAQYRLHVQSLDKNGVEHLLEHLHQTRDADAGPMRSPII